MFRRYKVSFGGLWISRLMMCVWAVLKVFLVSTTSFNICSFNFYLALTAALGNMSASTWVIWYIHEPNDCKLN
jgi:hypothetical protein